MWITEMQDERRVGRGRSEYGKYAILNSIFTAAADRSGDRVSPAAGGIRTPSVPEKPTQIITAGAVRRRSIGRCPTTRTMQAAGRDGRSRAGCDGVS